MTKQTTIVVIGSLRVKHYCCRLKSQTHLCISLSFIIAQGRALFYNQNVLIFFLLFQEKILWYSLTVSDSGASNEYRQHMSKLYDKISTIFE